MTGQTLSRDDLRSAVAAGLLTEAQAAGVMAHGDARAGRRALMQDDDEPFELFRGFADVFVAVGLVLLIAGVLTLAALLSLGPLLPALLAAVCWGLAGYFTRRRRMTLPSIVLVTGFGSGVALALSIIWSSMAGETANIPVLALVTGGGTIAALAAYYRAFKVPFTFFLIGLSGLAVVLVLTDSVTPDTAGGIADLFDLRQGSGLALGTLGFGVAAFLGGMWFDMRDPHRLGRWSATGFWLHLLAAPALVNTVALTVYNIGGAAGNLLTALALAVIAALALIIDRRSFLTAGIGYLGLLIGWAIRSGTGDLSPALLLLILGAFITGMGTWWVQLRGWIMTRLPDFPGKSRLPPYSEPS